MLQKVIDEGVDGNLNEFFYDASKFYSAMDDDLSEHDGNGFSAFQAVGEINFSPGEKLVVVTADVTGDLTERSGKKAQYEKAKKIIKKYMRYDAGIFVFSDPSGSFRLSLVYGTPDATRIAWSNFRRFTYFVSRDQTNNTFLGRVGGCNFSTLGIIKDAFSVEKVNKEFYKEIAKYYYRLTGKSGYERKLVLPYVREDDDKKYEEFAVRLIGRAIFCWFLKHKKSVNGIPLIPKELLSVSAVQSHQEYYHFILEPLFFELMNKPVKNRKPIAIPESDKIPFLNGGLFEPHGNDYYVNEPNWALKIPDRWFEDFFAVLEQYNFTIDENSTVDADVSVDPEMLGRIFENLLAEVDPTTGETARKATGSYYTPRVIVDYMVEQSLKQYLLTKTTLPEDKLNSLLSYEDASIDLSDGEKNAVVTALKEIKVIDPACGSGAFPMGILHRMLWALEKVDPRLEIWRRQYLSTLDSIVRQTVEKNVKRENWIYIRKLMIIRGSIYGVDIQPIAVEIAKLRCFLSLVVDEMVIDGEENHGVESLPNLEFKFVAANSLLGLPKLETSRKALFDFEDKESIEALARIRDNYFTSYGKYKLKAEQEFIEVQKKMFQFYLQNLKQEQRNLVGTVKKVKIIGKTVTQMLSEWEPFSNKQCEWFDSGWMFGEHGFDIIIANPPYLGEKGHKEIFRQIKRGTLTEYYQGKMDIFYFFFHLSIDLGNAGSQIAFITTNYYPTATGASKLRRDLKKRTIIRKLVNFNELKIFESAQGQHNMLTILSKGQDDNTMAATCITKRKGDAIPQTLQSIIAWQDDQTNYFEVAQKYLYEGDECYIRLTGNSNDSDNPIDTILKKLKEQGTYLKEHCNINAGADITISKITGKHIEHFKGEFKYGDGVFVIDDGEVSGLHLSNTELKIIKPFIKNSDIKKYFVNSSGDKLIYLRWEDNINYFPNIKKHLLRFKEILEDQAKRYEENYPWFALHRPREQWVFETQAKILVPYRCKSNIFGYSTKPLYSSRDVLFITEKDTSTSLKYVLALLNSRLYYFWLYRKGKRKGETLELVWQPLSEIPIKQISRTDQKPFISIADQILTITKDEDYLSNLSKQARVKELERQIDQLVYQLYGLTPEEIAVVEGSSKK